jgi:excisionase family DNA binding protein
MKAEQAEIARRKADARMALLQDLTISVEDAACLLGLSKAHAYDVIKEGKAPFPHIKIGRSIRVPAAAMRTMLGVEASAA